MRDKRIIVLGAAATLALSRFGEGVPKGIRVVEQRAMPDMEVCPMIEKRSKTRDWEQRERGKGRRR